MHERQLPPPIMIVQPKRKRWWRKWWVWVIIVVSVAVLATGGGFLYLNNWYKASIKPLSSEQSGVRVTVAQGMDGQAIAQLLEEKEVIRSARAFSKYLKKHGMHDLKAGTYLLSPSFSVAQIAAMLAEGKVDAYQLTLTPGRDLASISQSLQRAGFSQTDVAAALTQKYDHPLLASKPPGADLEGYIFPETYQLSSEVSPAEFIAHSMDVFYQQMQDQDLLAALQAQNLTLHQAFTLASIVQQESAKKDEQQKIAQVFLLRLEQGIPLGADPTFKYASRKAGVADDVAINSPYNTRRVVGLPPGPIGNFTLDALDAVAHPAATDYSYFVAGDDGVTHFSRTLDEHSALIRQYCTKLCQ